MSGGLARNDPIRVEVSVATLGRLLADGHLGAADLRCLDGASKRRLWRLCLASCVRAGSGCADCPCVACPVRGGAVR